MLILDCLQNFRGAALIYQKGEPVLEYSGGFADYANQIPNTLQTRFATASAGKAFIATAILQLIHQKRLGFETNLGEVLEIDLKGIDPEVTVRQLLNHTSGVPDYFDETVMEEYEELWVDYPNYKIRHNRNLLPLFIDKPMMYPRGERFQYNNTGYVLLAMIIEAIAGMEFDVYLRENVFLPCGMENTGYYELDMLPPGCASNYIWDEERNGFRTNIYSVDVKGTGAGGAFTTVLDVLRFWKGLMEYRLLPESMVREMTSIQSGDGKDPEEGFYGFGFWLIPEGDKGVIPYFQGCDPGVSCLSEYHPRTETVSVLVSNFGDNVWKIMREIRKQMYGE